MILSVLNVQLLGSEKQGVTLVPACNPKQTEASHCMMNNRHETGHPVALYQNSILQNIEASMGGSMKSGKQKPGKSASSTGDVMPEATTQIKRTAKRPPCVRA